MQIRPLQSKAANNKMEKYRERAVWELENPIYVFAEIKKVVAKKNYIYGFANCIRDGKTYFFRRANPTKVRIENDEVFLDDCTDDDTDRTTVFVGPLKFCEPKVLKSGNILFGEWHASDFKNKRSKTLKKGRALKWFVDGTKLLYFKNALKYGLKRPFSADDVAARILSVLWAPGDKTRLTDEECKQFAFFLADSNFYADVAGKRCEALDKKINDLKCGNSV